MDGDEEDALLRRRANATVSVDDTTSQHQRRTDELEPEFLIDNGKIVRKMGVETLKVDDDGDIVVDTAESKPDPTLSFRLCDPEDHHRRTLQQACLDRDVPPPFSQTTRVKTKASQASFIREKLLADKDVFDQDVLFLCRKYHGLHRRQHELLKKEHQQQTENLLMQQPLRERVFMIFENPQSCRSGRILAVVELTLVLVTLIQFMLETVPRLDPQFSPDLENMWFGIELVVTLFFTLETLARFLLSRAKIAFFKNALNLLDIIAVAPFYVLLFVDASGLGFVKVLRMCRFVKLFRRFRHIDALVITMSNIGASLVAPMLFLLVSVILIASFLFFVEGGSFLPAPESFIEDLRLKFHNKSSPSGKTGELAVLEALASSRYNKFYVQDCYCTSTPAFILGNRTCPDVPSRFDSILQAMWFGVVTITTAGYGDFVPVCAGGKVIASCGLLLSTIFLAMPIAIVGESFTETVAAMNERDEAKKKETATNIAVLRMDAEIADLGAEDATKERNAARSKARTAGEGLIRYLSATTRVRFLSPTDPPLVDGFGEATDPCSCSRSTHISPTSDSSRVQGRDTNRAIRRWQLAHHINAYTSTLMESWVASWIAEHVAAQSQDKSVTGSKLAVLRELASADVRSFPSTSKLRTSDATASVADEVILDRALEYAVVAEAPGCSRANLVAEGAPVLMNIYSKELRLPQVVARVVLMRGFVSRRLVVVPGCPTHQIAVNSQIVPANGMQVNIGDEINFTPQMRVTDAAFGTISAQIANVNDSDMDVTLLTEQEREARMKRLSAVGIHPIVVVLSEGSA
eukprot:CAMPEP_0174843100 /NCGR_PEP_ID=MMETSP1114-20130205/10306_1 /TAXON_ID=312471 /ORGANISM="Neobodo designis, Strain CCAP 1951/1" /LENGTH=805 /DNA_ID=CAMNT_0016077313 /DNA_START=23 /DNA_END=2437 /DNA_ORIENTATION=+